MSEPHFSIALTKCFYCSQDSDIVISKRFGRVKAIEEMQGKVISMMPCRKCEEWMKQGIILIGVISQKSDPNWSRRPPVPLGAHWMPNPYRSGALAVIKEAGFMRAFKEGDPASAFGLKNRWMFLEHEAGVKLGIWDKIDEQKPKL